jgi:hypothetical protein
MPTSILSLILKIQFDINAASSTGAIFIFFKNKSHSNLHFAFAQPNPYQTSTQLLQLKRNPPTQPTETDKPENLDTANRCGFTELNLRAANNLGRTELRSQTARPPPTRPLKSHNNLHIASV